MPPVPTFLGVRAFDDYPLAELVPYIDWMPFFNAWEFAGKFPDILRDPIVGEAASSLYADAQAHAEAADRRSSGCRRGPWSASSRPTRERRRHRVYTDETRTEVAAAAAPSAPAEVASRRSRPQIVPGGFHRAGGAAVAPTTSGCSR